MIMKNEPNIKVLLFDIYGTLLNMGDIKRKVNRLLDTKRGYIIWSEMLLHYSLVDNATQFHPFTDIASAAMKMAAKELGIQTTTGDFEEVMEALKHLPIHENVQEGLSALHDQDLRLWAMSNFSSDIVRERMERTGLVSYFDNIISAEDIKKYKPGHEAYQYACRVSETPAGEILLITSHGWDICGAMHAGMKTAYIERGGEVLYPLSPEPDFKAKDLTDLARQLITEPTA